MAESNAEIRQRARAYGETVAPITPEMREAEREEARPERAARPASGGGPSVSAPRLSPNDAQHSVTAAFLVIAVLIAARHGSWFRSLVSWAKSPTGTPISGQQATGSGQQGGTTP